MAAMGINTTQTRASRQWIESDIDSSVTEFELFAPSRMTSTAETTLQTSDIKAA
ncbi:hypothetical protein SAMN05428974_1005 [Sphingopyxis sp. YR583]|uniref:hypothetical protein n=1 Tax=Sphingopyxis sp. YR583 TaxID=1881047 RepID=UPI0008A737CF|nr:hypothetical protein [Sphingopyxis sp. YR583]SEH13922.1 hypothetical protein SAMN05428974_1005 [Sphingopyxis sp. YR583]